MKIRRYRPADCQDMATLFYDTVHQINARDYTPRQLAVWATGRVDLKAWNDSFLHHHTLVAEEGNVLVGFGDIDQTGYLDRLYVHKDYQGRGIATALCDQLERAFPIARITTHASITARPFFEGRGYHLVKEQQVDRQSVLLSNFVMEKTIGEVFTMPFNEVDRAQVLAEALPYIQKYSGKTIVVKYGGNAMVSDALRHAVISDIILLHLVGLRVVVVHGGGPEINEMLDKVGKQSKFVDGLRYTDEETMDIVQQVLCGRVNKNLVATLNRLGGRALGLCGMDAGLFSARKLSDQLGLVGEITHVDTRVVTDALDKGYIPVVSTVAQGEDAEVSYNVNADTAAAKLATALEAEKLILLTDVRGLLRDPKDESTLIPELQLSSVPALVREGVISGGMIPKIECCVESVRSGVKSAIILDGRVEHSILIELLSDAGIGTMLTN